MADHGLAHGVDGAAHRREQAPVVDADLVVIGGERLRDQVGVGELVAAQAAYRFEADAEGRQAALAALREQRDDEARVEPARQQHADGHVGDHATLDGQPQLGEQRLLPLAVGQRARGANEARTPVDGRALAPVGLDDPHRGGRQLAHAREDGVRRGNHRVEGHVVVQGRAIDRGVDAARRQQRRQGRREPQPARTARQVEGLYPQPVARHHQAAAVALDDDEGEHPQEPLDAGRAPAVIRLDDHLGVRGREEAVAEALELARAGRRSCRCTR